MPYVTRELPHASRKVPCAIREIALVMRFPSHSREKSAFFCEYSGETPLLFRWFADVSPYLIVAVSALEPHRARHGNRATKKGARKRPYRIIICLSIPAGRWRRWGKPDSTSNSFRQRRIPDRFSLSSCPSRSFRRRKSRGIPV